MTETEKFKITSLETLDEFLTDHDNSKNMVYFSSVPNACKEYPCILGIDEAGRGPVLGPMVYGTSYCPVNRMTNLETLECDDSKALTEEKRELIFSKICLSNDFIGWGVEVIAPQTICHSMLGRKKVSLNQISMDSAIKLIRGAIDAGVNVSHIYVDTVGPPEKYQAYLKTLFPKYGITVAKKADSTYPIVSAASICAKVTRDHSLKTWIFPEGLDIDQTQFGSGYPADPVTKRFLKDYVDPVFGFPQLARFSWSTAVNALEETAYHVEWENVEGKEGTSKDTKPITSFFKILTTSSTSKKRKRHEFFSERFLTCTTDL